MCNVFEYKFLKWRQFHCFIEFSDQSNFSYFSGKLIFRKHANPLAIFFIIKFPQKLFR